MAEKKKWGWGFLGAGRIATDFAIALKTHPLAEMAAVGASNLGRAQQFAEKFGFKHAFGSDKEVVSCPDVDVIYVNRTHNFHARDVKLAFEHNKAVLCEKPLTINSRESEELIKIAREKKLFLMMGVWTRFFPSIRRVLELIESGEIGEVTTARSDFGFSCDFSDPKRVDLKFGPGTLLEIGIYNVYWSGLVSGSHSPSSICATGKVQDGVDVQVGATMMYGDKLTTFMTSFTSDYYNEAEVVGTKGRIRLCQPFHCTTQLIIKKTGEKERVEEFTLPDAVSTLKSGSDGGPDLAYNFVNSDGMIYQVEHVTECLEKGLTESPLLPLDETLAMMKTLDELRRQVGVVYPPDSE